MKRIPGIALALAMLLSLAVCACAEAVGTVTLNWEDYASVLETDGVEGDFYTLENYNMMFWVPSALPQVELTEKDAAEGYICMFAADDGKTFATLYTIENDTITSMDQFLTGLAETEATDVERVNINGLDCVAYSTADVDAEYVTFLSESNELMQFAFSPVSDEDINAVFMVMMASIQPAA